MHSFKAQKRIGSTALVLAIGLGAVTLTGCTGSIVGPMVSQRTQGYDIPESALAQIRPGQSIDLVEAVLGTPQTQGTFGKEKAYYYVETKVEETTFGMRTTKSRTVLAVYFDERDKVKDKAVYGLQDGKVFAIESRRTASFGEDRTFIESILGSLQGLL